MKPKETIRVALINALKIYKEGLLLFLRKNSKIEIAGEVQTDQHFLKFIFHKKPHIILVDLCKPETGCVTGILNVLKHYPTTKVIILVTKYGNEVLCDFLQAGVHGFVVKEDDDEILTAIEEVYRGNTYYSKTIACEVKEILLQRKNQSIEKKQTITKREEAIIQCICEEMTNKEISEKMFLSVRTVEGYRLKILQKIQAKGTAGIVIYAIQKGIINIKSAAIYNKTIDSFTA